MNIQCSWKISDDRTISDAIFYNRDTDNIDLEDEINIENCILLKAPDKCEGLYPTIPACQLLICCEPPNCISRISAISEARVIEVYGHHGEYLKTIFNYPLDDSSDNLFVFRGDIELNKPLSVCSIKFVNLHSPNEMWLFGVKIHIDKECPSQNPVSLSTIAQKLENVGDSIDNKEEILRQCFGSLLKMGLPKFPTTKSDENLQNYIPAQEYLTSGRVASTNIENSRIEMNREKDVTSLMGNTLKLNDTNEDLKAKSSQQIQNYVSSSTSPIFMSHSVSTQTEEEYVNLEEKLKSYINEKIEGINKKFLEIETKLLCKLDEIESFVKPHGMQNNN